MSIDDEIKQGTRLFVVDRDDSPNARDPFLVVVEYLVERTTRTLLIVRVDRRNGVEIKYKTQQKWSRSRHLFLSAVAALDSYADQQEREATNRRNESERAALRAEWARNARAKE